MDGFYYLHTNGDLIFKPKAVAEDPKYFDSPFVKKVWPLSVKNRSDAWKIVLEGLALGCNKERAKELSDTWSLTFEDSLNLLKYSTPTEDMKDGLKVFIQEVLGMEVNAYWEKANKEIRKVFIQEILGMEVKGGTE